MAFLQETEFQHNVIDAVVLVLLSISGPDQKSNIKAAGGGLPNNVRVSHHESAQDVKSVCLEVSVGSPLNVWQALQHPVLYWKALSCCAACM